MPVGPKDEVVPRPPQLHPVLRIFRDSRRSGTPYPNRKTSPYRRQLHQKPSALADGDREGQKRQNECRQESPSPDPSCFERPPKREWRVSCNIPQFQWSRRSLFLRSTIKRGRQMTLRKGQAPTAESTAKTCPMLS